MELRKFLKPKLVIDTLTDVGIEPILSNGIHASMTPDTDLGTKDLVSLSYLGVSVSPDSHFNAGAANQRPESLVVMAMDARGVLMRKSLVQNHPDLAAGGTFVLPFSVLSCMPTSLLANPIVARPAMAEIEDRFEVLIRQLQRILGQPLTEGIEKTIAACAREFLNQCQAVLSPDGKAWSAELAMLEPQVTVIHDEVRLALKRTFTSLEILQNYGRFYDFYDILRQEYEVESQEHIVRLGSANTFGVYSSGKHASFSLYLPLPIDAVSLEDQLRSQIEDAIDLLEYTNV